MAQSLRDLRRRIRSVQNTKQITQAMKMVAAAKLRRAQERAENSRPYGEAMQAMLAAVVPEAGPVDLPLLEPRTVKRRGIIVVSADRGLCGPYNAQVIRRTVAEIDGDKETGLVVVGRKARDFFRRRGYPILAEFTGLGDDPRYVQARAIGEEAVRLFLAGEVDEVTLVYNQFVNAMSSRPIAQRLLPLNVSGLGEAGPGPSHQYLFEPAAETVLAELLPKYLETLVYRALLEAKASEQGMRMTAMDSATKNSEELIRKLVLVRNRVRQAAITKEIIEIVSGAAAI